jgi:hypothetical protein
MTFSKLRDRATLGLEGNAIRQMALQFLYEAEAEMCMRAKCYQKHNLNLMVDPDNVNIVDLPSDFSELIALPEWKSIPLEHNPKWQDDVRRKSDGTWYTGTPYEYYMQNNQVVLYPEPDSYAGENKLGVFYAASAPDTHAAVAEITKITCYGETTLDGADYFYISSTATDWYVWFDVDNGSVDPAITGRTGVEVDISADDSATTVATALQTALDLLTNITATSSGAVVTVTNDTAGAVKSEAIDVNTMFIFNVTTPGQDALTSPVFDNAYHTYLVDYAKGMLLHEDGKINRGDRKLATFYANVEMVKRHFKSRVSPNIGRLRDTGGGPISGPHGRRGFGGRVKEVSVSSS